MITREVVHKLRGDREQILGSIEVLCHRTQGTPAHRNVTKLAKCLRDYVGLVDAVLDAYAVEGDGSAQG